MWLLQNVLVSVLCVWEHFLRAHVQFRSPWRLKRRSLFRASLERSQRCLQSQKVSHQFVCAYVTAIVQNPAVQKFWGNAKVELAFPGPSEWPQVMSGFSKVVKSAKTGAFANLTVKEGAKNALVFIEVASLFYVGEIIGRGSIIGYDP